MLPIPGGSANLVRLYSYLWQFCPSFFTHQIDNLLLFCLPCPDATIPFRNKVLLKIPDSGCHGFEIVNEDCYHLYNLIKVPQCLCLKRSTELSSKLLPNRLYVHHNIIIICPNSFFSCLFALLCWNNSWIFPRPSSISKYIGTSLSTLTTE